MITLSPKLSLLFKRLQRRFIMKRLLVIIIFTYLIFWFNSSKSNPVSSVKSCHDLLNKKIDILKGNIEHILNNPYDLLKSAYVDLMSDRVANEIFNEYNQADTKISPNNKVYLSDIRVNANKNNRDFYLIVEYTKIGNAHKYCDLKLNDSIISFFNDQNNYLAEKKVSNKDYTLLDNCNYKNCFFSCDKSKATESDALLFHLTDLDILIKQAPSSSYEDVYNSIFNFPRNKSQTWILWNDEANHVEQQFDDFNMNWTISYLYESEASYASYGTYQKSKEEWTMTRIEKEFMERSDNSIWFVSNCNSKYRNRFVPKLSQFTNVNIYGKCESTLREQNPDLNLENVFRNESCGRETECESNLLKGNKFFLAFENTNCTNYITEKFWRSLSYDIIPVVAVPPKAFYDRMAPDSSFIHAEEFDFDPEKLGNYLKNVASNINLFAKYFKWKQVYASEFDGYHVESLRMCELCYRLNTEKYHVYYESVSNFFNEKCYV